MGKKRVLLVGTGGIGTVCAYSLEIGGLATVTAVMRSNFESVLKDGIDIDSCQYGHDIKGWRPTRITKSVPDVSTGNVEPFAFILVTTKNIWDVPPIMADIIAPAVVPGETAIVLAQNGLNIEKPFIERFPTNPLICSVVYTGASEVSFGKVNQSDPDVQRIGPFKSPGVPQHVAEEAAQRFIAIYNPSNKLDITFSADVAPLQWRKLAFNASINSVAAILRMDTSRMRMSKHIIDDLILPIAFEVRDAARASGITLQHDLVDSMMRQDPPNAFFKPSMLQDVEKGNLMEIETIVREPLRVGEALGVPMPTLRLVYNILKGIQLQIKEKRGLWKPDWQPENPYYVI